MSYCSSCGTQSSGSAYCSNCGTSLTSAPAGQSTSTTVYPPSAMTPPAAPTTSTMAVVAFVLSLIISVVGLILGYIARAEIDRSEGRLGGRKLATAAIVIGWIWVAFFVLLVMFGAF
jgi:hypothetical protein